MCFDPSRVTDPEICRKIEERAKPQPEEPLSDDVMVLQRRLRDIRDNMSGLRAVTCRCKEALWGWYYICAACGERSQMKDRRDLVSPADIEHSPTCYVTGLLKLAGYHE